MSIAVFHNAFGDRMRFVAQVEGSDLERAYMLTNSIDTQWFNNDDKDELTVYGGDAEGIRSTSMDDIMIDLATSKVYVVAMCGFEEVTEDTVLDVAIYNEERTKRSWVKQDLAATHRLAVNSMMEGVKRGTVSSRIS